VLGGGSFATAMGAALARRKREVDVVMLLRREDVCAQINDQHENPRYLPGISLPHNLTATTDAAEALADAQYAVHAVPVQASREFLKRVRHLIREDIPLVCLAKGIEQTTGYLLSELIPSALERDQPTVFLSGPSFAKEVWPFTAPCS
jgi:glycerol-3-phosphate dehydrogenase (NAD+)